MVRKLSTRLTVVYGGLFGLALCLIGPLTYTAVRSYARESVQNEMSATAAVFDRLWKVKSDTLQTNAELLSRDFGFISAMATDDRSTVASAFANLRQRVNADTGLVLTSDGQLLAGDDTLAKGVEALLAESDTLDTQTGVVALGDGFYNVVAAPVLAPDLKGWIVFASRLDRKAMADLEALSAIPLHAMVSAGDAEEAAQTITANTPLPTLDTRHQVVLRLSYPVAKALDAYKPLLNLLLAIGVLSLMAVVAASLVLARHLTKPVTALIEATAALRDGRATQVEVKGEDEMAQLAATFNDMAVSIKERESDIRHLATHEIATGMPNSKAAEAYLSETTPAILICVGLQHYGHLRAVWGAGPAHAAMRALSHAVSTNLPEAFVARTGPDELLIVSQSDIDLDALLKDLNRRHDIGEQSLDLIARLGLYYPHTDVLPPTAAIERARIALDQARSGKQPFAVYSAETHADMADALRLTDELHSAITAGVLSVHYQPKYNYRTQTLSGLEALVRWNHPQRGMVSPQRFVTLAEEAGYIPDLTRHVLKTVLADQKTLSASGFDVDISVNYSGRLLSDDAFNAETLSMCQAHPGRICLEITETAVIEDPDTGLKAIDRFCAAGIEISIDDFGTGLSSLSYLKMIPAHELKIDRAFISEIEQGQRDALLVRSTIELAHSLGMKVTAEGVETPTSLAILAAMGCDMAQGYGIARPMPLDALLAHLTSFDARSLGEPKMELRAS